MPRAKAQSRKGRGGCLVDVRELLYPRCLGLKRQGFLNSEKLCAFAALREITLNLDEWIGGRVVRFRSRRGVKNASRKAGSAELAERAKPQRKRGCLAGGELSILGPLFVEAIEARAAGGTGAGDDEAAVGPRGEGPQRGPSGQVAAGFHLIDEGRDGGEGEGFATAVRDVHDAALQQGGGIFAVAGVERAVAVEPRNVTARRAVDRGEIAGEQHLAVALHRRGIDYTD